MTPWIPRLLFAQIVFSALAAVRGVLPGCGGCGGVVDPFDFVLGMTGAIFYFFLWWTAMEGLSVRLVAGIGAAVGAHSVFVARMAIDDSYCLWCVLAAVGALVVLTLLLLRRDTSKALVIFCALGAASVFALPMILRKAPPRATDRVRIVVYETVDCPYCWDLKYAIIPRIIGKYGDLISVKYRSADRHHWVRRTPTIVFEDEHRPEVIEGLPSERFLRRSIEQRLPRLEAKR